MSIVTATPTNRIECPRKKEKKKKTIIVCGIIRTHRHKTTNGTRYHSKQQAESHDRRQHPSINFAARHFNRLGRAEGQITHTSDYTHARTHAPAAAAHRSHCCLIPSPRAGHAIADIPPPTPKPTRLPLPPTPLATVWAPRIGAGGSLMGISPLIERLLLACTRVMAIKSGAFLQNFPRFRGRILDWFWIWRLGSCSRSAFTYGLRNRLRRYLAMETCGVYLGVGFPGAIVSVFRLYES